MLRALITLGVFVLGVIIGIAWSNDQSFVSIEEARSSEKLCIMYFAENAPTSAGAEIGANMCRQITP